MKTLKTKFEELQFNNKGAAAIIGTMVDEIQTWVDRKKGAEWKAVVMTVAFNYPEDRAKIYDLLGAKTKERPTGGGAKITRKGGRKGYSVSSAPCDGCPQSNAAYSDTDYETKVQPMKRKAAPPAEPIVQEGEDPQTKVFNSITEVVDAFQGSAAAIISWAQAKDIQIPPNVSRAETAAKYVMKHYEELEVETNTDAAIDEEE